MQDPPEQEPDDRAFMELMRELNSRAVSTESVFTRKPASGQDASDEEQVRCTLHELGYI